MAASAPDLDEFDQEDIPTGVKILIGYVPEQARPFAEMFAKEHYAALRMVRDIRSILRGLRLLAIVGSVIGSVLVVVGAVIAWLLVHVEVHR